MSPLPAYYTTLAPFQSAFATGWPILTYHKVGPRPRGVRLKGLYASPSLFRRQMAELHRAGFQSLSLDSVGGTGARPPRSVVLTFDDGFDNVRQHALEALAASGFRSIQFLVSKRLGGVNDWEMAEGEVAERLMSPERIREWLAAGQEIGAHTQTHPYLTRIPLARAREEIRACKKELEDLFGRPIRHFCYPYGDLNDAVVDLVRDAGYDTACTTRTGLNATGRRPHELERLTVRYRSRSMRELRAWIRSAFGRCSTD